MLKQRVLTALPLAIGIVAAIFYLPRIWAGLILVVIIALGAREWAQLAGLRARPAAWLYTALVAASGWLLWQWLGATTLPLAVAGGLWWLLVQLWMIFRDPRPSARPASGPMDPGWLAAGWMTLAVSLACALAIFADPERGPALLLFTMMIVWAADIGAYFSGRRFGRRKLAPLTSPGKTWEGVAGGLLAVVLLALIASPIFAEDMPGRSGFVVAALLAGAVSVLGDLLESRLKRAAGAKDSGTLLPGHGGVLDRIDSLTAAAPVFLLGLSVLPG